MLAFVLCRLYQLHRDTLCLIRLFEEIRRKVGRNKDGRGEVRGERRERDLNLHLTFFYMVLCRVKETNHFSGTKEFLHFSRLLFRVYKNNYLSLTF